MRVKLIHGALICGLALQARAGTLAEAVPAGTPAAVDLADTASGLALRLARELRPAKRARPAPREMRGAALALRLGRDFSWPGNLPRSPEAPAPERATAALLERARLWRGRNRDDLAREDLNKLFRIDPEHADALALLALIQSQAGQGDNARNTAERLRKRYPQYAGLDGLETALRLNGVDKSKMAHARLLAKTGHPAEALAALRQLYGSGFPEGDLALEYWQAMDQLPDTWAQVQAGLLKLLKDNPDNPRYRLAWAEHASRHLPVNQDALKIIIQSTLNPTLSREARSAWRKLMLRLEPLASSVALIGDYLAVEAGDTAVQERLAAMSGGIEARRRLLADPYYQAKLAGLALLDGGNLALAEDKLERSLAGRANDAETVAAMGVLRMRQGHNAEAQGYFLKAQRLDPARSEKWAGLLRTARYWGLMKQAGDARDGGEFALAEQKLKEARAIDPGEPNALAALGRVYAEQKRLPEAEQSYRAALRLEAGNANALGGLLALLLRDGRAAQADALHAGQPATLRAELLPSFNGVKAGLLREQALAQEERGNLRVAIVLLEQALGVDQDDPWLRYALARLYVNTGTGFAKGQALFQELLARRPGDAAALYALALFQSGQKRDFDALLTLERIGADNRSAKFTQMQRGLWISVQSQRALALERRGERAAAVNILEQAEAALDGERDLALELVEARIAMGQVEAAKRLLKRVAQQGQPPLAWQLQRAQLLARMDEDGESRLVLEQIAADKVAPNTEQQEILARLRADLDMRNAEQLRKEGRFQEALAALPPEVADTAGVADAAGPATQARLARAVRRRTIEARILRGMQRWDAALEDYRAILGLQPENQDAAVAWIETLVEAGQPEQARARVLRWLASGSAPEADTSVALLGLLIDLKDWARARQLAESILQADPGQARALAHAARLAQDDGRIEQAIDYYRRAQSAEMVLRLRQTPPRLSSLARAVPLADGLQPPLASEVAAPSLVAEEARIGGGQAKLAELLDQQTAWAAVGLDSHFRTGTGGTSQLKASELTTEWKPGWRAGGSWFFRGDLVDVNAGEVDLAEANFGTLAAARAPGGLRCQSAKGLAIGAGLQQPGLRLDIGTSPLGFPVTNLLGGVLKKGDLGPLSYSLDLSRRPVTGSLLSWAGARDPLTGRVWGGVVASGIRLGLSKDEGGALGAWSALGLHQLTGKNVQENTRMQLMGGAYWRVINQTDRLLSVGLTAMHWRFSENAGEYSFGHGGYYSPGKYSSVSFPLTFGGRSERFSYTLRAALSASWSSSKDAAYFPRDPVLQAAAGDPHYGGGPNGRSYGRSLAATWEYQVNPKLFVGGKFELDRSPDYSPNRLFLYLRYAPRDSAARPVSFPPEPFIPSSQF